MGKSINSAPLDKDYPRLTIPKNPFLSSQPRIKQEIPFYKDDEAIEDEEVEQKLEEEEESTNTSPSPTISESSSTIWHSDNSPDYYNDPNIIRSPTNPKVIRFRLGPVKVGGSPYELLHITSPQSANAATIKSAYEARMEELEEKLEDLTTTRVEILSGDDDLVEELEEQFKRVMRRRKEGLDIEVRKVKKAKKLLLDVGWRRRYDQKVEEEEIRGRQIAWSMGRSVRAKVTEEEEEQV